MTDFLEYSDVVQEIRGATNSGRLKLQSNMVVFKNLKTGVVEQFQAADVEKTSWLLRARGYCLKIMLKNGSIHRFDGFKEPDFTKLSAFMTRYYKKDLEKIDLSVRGWNWGVSKFTGNALEFEIHEKLAFEIPLANVSHVTTAKNEVTLEFHQNDDAAVSLLEMRFHIPQDASSEKDAVDEFYDNVMKKADILQATGDAICLFSEVQCLTPRGRYDIKLYSSFLQLHGKTFDYKIPFSTVIRLFLLPHKDNRQVYFVVSLDPPIKQGQTRYHFLILLFNKDDETTLELGLSEKDLAEKYDGKLNKEMSGPEYEIVSKLMKALLNKKITVPGDFVGHSGAQSVDCAYKSSNGFLYPLERGFVYVHKPPFYVRFDEISCVNFGRNSGNTRFFDFDVETKTGTIHSYSSIAKEEYNKLFDFVKSKGLRVKNIGNKESVPAVDDMLGSDQEDEHDAYLLRMQQEGREAEAAASDDDSEDESTDEDFEPTAVPSDVAEEFDTSASSGEEGEEGSKKDGSDAENKKKPKKEKRKKTITIPEGGTKRKRKEKKVKDPNMPKRPQSAYFIWLNESREKIKQEHPGLSITEISKVAGEKWKTVGDKSKYDAAAKKAKEDYEKAMAEYRKSLKEAEAAAGPKNSDSEPDGTPAPAKPRGKKALAASESSSAKKPAPGQNDSKAGSGDAYKSKEFISSSEGSSGSEEEKPAKKKPKSDNKPAPAASKVPDHAPSGNSSSENEQPTKKKVKKEAPVTPAKKAAAAKSAPAAKSEVKKTLKKDVSESEEESEASPVKKAPATKRDAKKNVKKDASESEEESGGSPVPKKAPTTRNIKKNVKKESEEDSEVGELPSDEEILSSPEASEASESDSGSD